MIGNDQQHLAKDSALRCSISCIRAGSIALILSCVALILISPVNKQERIRALAEYYSLRVQLSESLKQLERHACWKEVLNLYSLDKVKEWNLETILTVFCEFDHSNLTLTPMSNKKVRANDASDKHPQQIVKDLSPKSSLTLETPLPAVTAVTLVSRITLRPLNEIVEIFEKLGSGTLLMNSRETSTEFNISIYRWVRLRHALLYTSTVTYLVKEGGKKDVIEHEEGKVNFVPDVTKKEILKRLSLGELYELDAFEFPDLEKYNKLGTFSLSLPIPGTGPLSGLNVDSAGMFAQFVIFLCVFWFWIFQNEAINNNIHFMTGTVFCAFKRNALAQIVFKMLVSLPPIASMLLTLALPYSSNVLAGFFSVFIVFFSALIAYSFTRHQSN